MTDLALDLSGLVHRYGRSYVLRGAALRLERGRSLALYGSNGSGKTTLLKIVATLVSPTRGGGTVLGHALDDPQPIRARALLVSHALGLYPDLSGLENLEFAARMHGRVPTRDGMTLALETVGLIGSGAAKVPPRVRGYSSGMRKRLALAKVILLEPDLVLLDEPFAALDPAGKDLVENLLLRERARGASLVVASHEPERARKVVDLETTLSNGLLSEPLSPETRSPDLEAA